MTTSDRYEVVSKEHGEGGFGKVSIQNDKILDRLVAVKSLILFEEEEMRERFIREAKVLARMSYTNIPAIYDISIEEKSIKIYFEYIDGQTIREILASGSIPSMDEIRIWFTQIAAALEHAHGKSIIHRDIKPENIIISKDKKSAYLVDFGIALTSEDIKRITESGYVIGTVGYMSPEQMAGEKLNEKTDIYSLGISLYESLCGHLPQIGAYHKLSEENESIPPAIDEIVGRCLSQNPQLRFTASEFINAMKDIFRTNIPLSTLLTEGRLHELYGALYDMTSEEFTKKPKGQKLLIINRVKDLIKTDSNILRAATADMIGQLLRLGIYEMPSEYCFIVESALDWGFNKSYSPSWTGNDQIRIEIISASKMAQKEILDTMSKCFIGFISQIKLAEKPSWYLHDLRRIVMALLANQYCENYAEELAKLYSEINEISHSG